MEQWTRAVAVTDAAPIGQCSRETDVDRGSDLSANLNRNWNETEIVLWRHAVV